MAEGTKKNTILIITGGNVDTDFAALWVKENGFKSCIAADRGAEAALELGLDIDLLIGDLDSVDKNVIDKVKKKGAGIIKLDPEKDATDTQLAIEEAARRGAARVYLLGATGERADHTFTSLMNIVQAKKQGLSVIAVDKYNKIYASEGDICIEKDGQHGDFVSLSVISDYADITIKGMKYELEDKRVFRGSSLCQSNEVIRETAEISIRNGLVLVFESRDGGCADV